MTFRELAKNVISRFGRRSPAENDNAPAQLDANPPIPEQVLPDSSETSPSTPSEQLEHLFEHYTLSPTHPIYRQFFPLGEDDDPDWAQQFADPLGENTSEVVKGVIHRYKGRALLLPTFQCAAYCNFCFRRSKVQRTPPLTQQEIYAAIAYLAGRKDITKIILSGGDPLMLPGRQFRDLIEKLCNIPQLEELRIHTRMPVVNPQSMFGDKLMALGYAQQQRKKNVVLVVHSNHPVELKPGLASNMSLYMLDSLIERGVTLFSQSVLLRTINDNAKTLYEMVDNFIERGIFPYYIHHPDLVPGTKRFHVSLGEGRKIIGDLYKKLDEEQAPFAKLRYIIEVPGGHGKVDAMSSHVAQDGQDWLLQNEEGEVYRYNDTAKQPSCVKERDLNIFPKQPVRHGEQWGTSSQRYEALANTFLPTHQGACGEGWGIGKAPDRRLEAIYGPQRFDRIRALFYPDPD